MKSWNILGQTVVLFIFLCTSGCGNRFDAISTLQPSPVILQTPSPTSAAITAPPPTFVSSLMPTLGPTPGYYRYMPQDESLFRFQFDYAPRWVLDKYDYATSTYDEFWLFEDAYQGELLEQYSYITLSVAKNSPITVQDSIEQAFLAYKQLNGSTIEDRAVSVGGYSGRGIVVDFPPILLLAERVQNMPARKMISVYVAVDTDLYQFDLYVPITEKTDDLVNDYWELLEGAVYIP